MNDKSFMNNGLCSREEKKYHKIGIFVWEKYGILQPLLLLLFKEFAFALLSQHFHKPINIMTVTEISFSHLYSADKHKHAKTNERHFDANWVGRANITQKLL